MMNNKDVTLLELCGALLSILRRHPELIRVYTHNNLDGVSIYTNDDNPVEDYDEYTVYK